MFRIGRVVFLVGEERWRHYFVNIIFIFADGLFLCEELCFEKIFIFFFIFVRKGRRGWWLYLPVDDLINRQVSILIFILLVKLFFCVELLAFLHFGKLLVDIGVVFWVML